MLALAIIKTKKKMENSIKIYVDNLPKGAIIMWYGEKSQIPDGWKLCDGHDGRPNLINKFVVGAGSEYYKGQTGGENAVKLDINQMPKHSHDIYEAGKHKHKISGRKYSGSWQNTLCRSGDNNDWAESSTHEAGNHTHSMETVGGDSPHENRPPFVAVFFIIKIV